MITVNTNDLKPNEKNPRYISESQFDKLKKSLKEAPWMLNYKPIIVDDQNIILAGNMRHKAALAIGLKQIPVLRASDLSEKQKAELIVKDNLSFGQWEWDTLANEWDTSELVGWGMDEYYFGTEDKKITFDDEEEEAPAKVGESKPDAKITDTGYVRFEVVLREEFKKTVVNVLNQTAAIEGCTIGDALYVMAEKYQDVLNEKQ